ncbi:hypothetical protein [Intrasporangium flavum]|uniref:hypothetical protein n=1 Tax=Intrasporangium flavum TaxID=1428657 RepID=UPI00096BE12F|nr:hypothetical protein [Intrasporangium flavum]
MRGRRVVGQVLAAVVALLAAVTVPGQAAAAPEGRRAPAAVAAAAQPTAAPSAVAAAPVWGPPVAAIPDRGQPSDVSCPTSTWCMAVDLSGRVMTFNGTTWSAPKVVFPRVADRNPDVRAVSCPTTSFCLAVSAHGYGVYRSGTWTVVSSPYAPFKAVDCYSATRCGIMRGEPYSGRSTTMWNGSTLSAPVTTPWAARVDAIACPSATVCHAIGLESKGGAIALRTSGSGWVASYLGKAWWSTTTDISCASASFCLITSGSAYRTWRWNGSAWAGSSETQDNLLLDVENVSCTSSTSCTAVGDERSGRWDGRSWTTRDLYPIYGASYSMDCATSTTCVVVDDRGRWWRGGSTWTAARSFDPTSQWVNDVSCPSATFCLATDRLGNAVRWNGAAWTGMTRLGTQPSEVECLSTTWCMVLDSQQGTYRLWTGSWGPAVTFDLVNWWPHLTCGSTTTCFVFGLGDARRWNGRTWGAEARLFSTDVTAADCAGSGFCMAMDANGVMRTWNGTAWSAARSTGVTFPSDLSCTSRTFCLAESEGGLYSTWNGSSWTVRRTLPSVVGRISCTSSTRCIGTGSDGSAWLWSGASWAKAPSGPGIETLALDCRSTWCMAVGYTQSSRTS